MRHLLKNSYDPQDYLNDIEYLECLTEDKSSYAINNKEDENYLDIIKEYDDEIITCKNGIKVWEEGWKQKESADMKKEIMKLEEWAEEKMNCCIQLMKYKMNRRTFLCILYLVLITVF